jgi:hypothetical protein
VQNRWSRISGGILALLGVLSFVTSAPAVASDGTSELLPAKPAHLSQVSRGQPSLSDQVGDDGFELVEVTT